MTTKRALISVSDKHGVVDFARRLAELGVEILSTGGTRKAIQDAGIPVVAVSEFTGAPEILDGRVKTLHPKIHAGILARPTSAHRDELAAQGLSEIDLVVVNLYPFEATVADGTASYEDAIENIDIGGPTMLRAAAKNHERVTVVVDPRDYDVVVGELAGGGEVSAGLRKSLARKVFAHTAAYDGAITQYLIAQSDATGDDSQSVLPAKLISPWNKVRDLRYGENPHQQAALYATGNRDMGLPAAQVLHGKEPSYNNYLDLDAAHACCSEFEEPTVVIVKHTNPCGVASADNITQAYTDALACDPVSAFGGIVASNRPVTEELAQQLGEIFLECVIAPAFEEGALSVLTRKKNIRLVKMPAAATTSGLALRNVQGGVLVQTADTHRLGREELRVVTERTPTEDEKHTLQFAWRVAKHVKSNAVIFCTQTRSVAVGAGQMSRVDSVRIAKHKAQSDLAGSCVASDAFFPFRDGVDVLAEAGAKAVIQPGGSIRDEEVIAAANEHGMAMVFTGVRHFRH